MECLLMQPMSIQNEEELDDVIDMEDYTSKSEQSEEDSDGVIVMQQYSDSGEDQEASWWDLAKDVVVQPVLGAARAFTWPADVLKLAMVGDALSDLDELEAAFEKAGTPFDRNEYIKNVSENSQFIPTQDLVENLIEEKAGIDLKPKTKTGKILNKFFTLASLTRGKGLTKAITAGAVGAGTTEGLKSLGVNETASELIGDVAAGGSTAFRKSPRILSPEIASLEKTAAKHGLPFPEYLTRDPKQLIAPVISEKRKLALQNNLGMTSKEAIDDVITGKLNPAKLRKQGADLEVLVDDAYDNVKNLAKQNPKKVPTKNIVNDIDMEIARIKKNAPSPSDADKAAISILENEKDILSKSTPTTENLVEQIKNYNSNVKSIYKRSEFSGREDSVRSAYAFLNNSIRNTVEAESGTDIRKAMRAADTLYSEKSKLDRVESLVSKSFKDGDYNPKKLSQLLNSKQGLIVRRELGDDAVNQIRDIAKFGEQAVKATTQLAKSPTNLGRIAEWGPLAGFLLYHMPKSAGMLIGAKAIGDRVRGYLLTNPASREVYRDIVKNASKGSFKNMATDFDKLESSITKSFGSMDEFMKAMQEDLELIED